MSSQKKTPKQGTLFAYFKRTATPTATPMATPDQLKATKAAPKATTANEGDLKVTESGDAGAKRKLSEAFKENVDGNKGDCTNDGPSPAAKKAKPEEKQTPSETSKFLERFSRPETMSSPPPPAKKLKQFESPKDGKKTKAFESPKTPAAKKNDSDSTPIEKGHDASQDFPHLQFDFLQPSKIKDKKGRRPHEPGYDPNSLYVPEQFLNGLTPAQRQWWDLKSSHFQTVLFFKMGKFYELFHMDAVLAVKECNLIFMKKEMAHCGFPEAAFDRYANMLIAKGIRLARIEQTETPVQMEERCRSMNRATKFDKVVKREICQVLSPGTLISCDDSGFNFLLALCDDDSTGRPLVGFCFIDPSIGRFNIGQFEDDCHRSQTRMLLAHKPPTEVLYGNSSSTQEMKNIIANVTAGRKESVSPEKNFFNVEKVLKLLEKNTYFGTDAPFPDGLNEIISQECGGRLEASEDFHQGLKAFAAIVKYLEGSLVEHELLALKDFKIFRKSSDLNTGTSTSAMILDNSTLANLDILGQSDEPSLFAVVNRTCTPFGKRLLQQWMCSPLTRIKEIHARQVAIQDLGSRGSVLEKLKHELKKLPDLEKRVRSVQRSAIDKSAIDHPEARAVRYDAALTSKKTVNDFIAILGALRSVYGTVKDVQNDFGDSESALLKKYIVFDDKDGFPDFKEHIEFFDKAFDMEKAKKEGRVYPNRGVDEDYDNAKSLLKKLQKERDEYLDEQAEVFRCEVKYWGTGKNAFQLEVPEHACKRAGSDHVLASQKKGFKRFETEETKEFLRKNDEALEMEQNALNNTARSLYAKFSGLSSTWERVIACLANLDAIISLYEYSFNIDGDAAFPVLEEPENGNNILRYTEGRHPILTASTFSTNEFVPNDLTLDDRLIILTGPNMGGKSTLMRQTALLAILAQVGCKVPAQSMTLTPIDRIFTRMGASDNLFGGESTFMVELTEASSILEHVGRNSLVIVDELGRGTSTFDGVAIASAVVDSLSKTGCRTIFSTHYQNLTQRFSFDESIAVFHMGYIEELQNGEPKVTFLYRASPGVCDRSLGCNAARMAGVPESVVDRADRIVRECHRAEEVKREFVKVYKDVFAAV